MTMGPYMHTGPYVTVGPYTPVGPYVPVVPVAPRSTEELLQQCLSGLDAGAYGDAARVQLASADDCINGVLAGGSANPYTVHRSGFARGVCLAHHRYMDAATAEAACAPSSIRARDQLHRTVARHHRTGVLFPR